tara:strand:- start:4 stop:432 length:429 start_codon:yes stop_codon:yes gene_type:complete
MKKILTIFIGLVLLGGCTKTIEVEKIVEVPQKSRFKGDYPTLEIRNMWTSCFQGQQMVRVPPPIGITICDCLVDTTRQDYDYTFLYNEQQTQLKARREGDTEKDEKISKRRQDYWAKVNIQCTQMIQGGQVSPENLPKGATL